MPMRNPLIRPYSCNTFMTNHYIQYVYNLIKTNFHTNIIFPSEENKKLKFIFVFTFINFP